MTENAQTPNEQTGHQGPHHQIDDGETGIDRAEAFLATTPTDEAGNTPERLAEVNELGEKIVEKLKDIFDPEIPVNIYELGLIYKIDVHDDNSVSVDMTLTSPNCPVAESLPLEVQHKVESADGVVGCEINIVWEPCWHPSMMTEEAQLELGLIY